MILRGGTPWDYYSWLALFVGEVVVAASLIFCSVYFPARRLNRTNGSSARLAAGASVTLGVIGLLAFIVLNPIRNSVAQGGIRPYDPGFAALSWLADYLGGVAAIFGGVAGVVGMRSTRRQVASFGLALSALALPLWFLLWFYSHAGSD